MSSINKVILIGRLGKDPELRYTTSGAAICNITLATSRSWKDKNTGEKQEDTEWSRVSLFDKTAEVAGQYLKKGSLAYIEGRLKTRKWIDKENVERYVTEIMAERLQLLGGRDEVDRPAARPAQSKPAANPAQSTGSGFDGMDDDIPF